MKPEPKTQGRRLIESLKRRPFTYLEMQMMGVSTCPWKRISESLYKEKEKLLRVKGRDGLIRWSVRPLDSRRTVG